MSNAKNIIDNLKNQGANPDKSQINLINELCNLNIRRKFPFYKLLFNDGPSGIYIWGDVGRGKTLVTKAYLDELNRDDIKSFHYIDLMSFIHDELNINSGIKNPLLKVSKSLTKNISIIFIDEFQVEDVADAMIVGKLLKYLNEFNLTLYLTSNAHPSDLYKDGLQRKQFIDDMNIISQSFNVFELNGEIDYRARNIVNTESVNSKKSYTDDEIKEIIDRNFYNKDYSKNKFSINSREFSCKAFSNDFLWLSFERFFNEPNGAEDYIEISKKTEWIFLNDFKSCDDDSADIIRRFISFIDICYRDETKIKFFFDNCSHQNLYTGQKLKILWDRCHSRLSEMRTPEYLS